MMTLQTGKIHLRRHHRHETRHDALGFATVGTSFDPAITIAIGSIADGYVCERST
jgi:hypothetical protein